MEEDILQIFLDKIGRLSIAQNFLITNKETSYEEIQAFLNRAILSRYIIHYFFVEINESFSEYQQRYLNRFIDKLLSYKNESYNKIEKNTVEKKRREFMDSCLVFIYNEKSNSALSYIRKEINRNKMELKSIHGINISTLCDDELNESRSNERDELFQNIHVIKSEICRLGKIQKIKKQIEEKGKEYIHLPVGGNVTRNILFQKLKAILKKFLIIKLLCI